LYEEGIKKRKDDIKFYKNGLKIPKTELYDKKLHGKITLCKTARVKFRFMNGTSKGTKNKKQHEKKIHDGAQA
jgi:hypothetical protein